MAQEDATSTSDTEVSEEVIEMQEEIVVETPLLITNVSIEREEAGQYRVSWMTSDVAAGAITYMTSNQGGAIQHRLTNGRFSKQHQYVIEGLPAGTNSILLESVGSDLSYARKAVEVMAPEVHTGTTAASPVGLMVIFFFLTPLVLLVIVEELFRLRKEVKRNFKDLSDKVKPKRTATRRKKVPSKTVAKKTTTKKTDKK